MKRVAFTTLGCKANWVDTEELISSCRGMGLTVVPFDDAADVYVVNTCTVTAVASQQSRQMLRRARRMNPKAIVVAVGCGGEVERDAILAIDGIDAVFGTADRDVLIEYLLERFELSLRAPQFGAKQSRVTSGIASFPVVTRNDAQSRARAFIKIQDGCDRACAYCIVPKARGRGRSVPIDEVARRCIALKQNHREIVLTGIDIGQYRDAESGAGLVGLLKKLAAIDGMPRLRVSSIDPLMVSEEFIGLIASSGRICRHIHLSIQSASDPVLKRMGRNYSAADVKNAATALAENIPGIAITGDIIAGFPGESDKDYDDAISLLATLPLAALHIFPYSERDGTRAAAMDDQVPQRERKSRAALLRKLAADARGKFLNGMIGKPLDVIVTSRIQAADGTVAAFSDNAISVSLPAGIVPYAGIGRAVITEVDDLKARGSWLINES